MSGAPFAGAGLKGGAETAVVRLETPSSDSKALGSVSHYASQLTLVRRLAEIVGHANQKQSRSHLDELTQQSYEKLLSVRCSV
jgi:phage host-nuclease inhibitor protein Gam